MRVRGILVALTCRFLAFRKRICALTPISCWRTVLPGGAVPALVTAIAVLGIIGTGFAYVLNYQIITSDGATVASTVTYLLPVVAIVLGVLVLNESVTVTVLAGIALVLAGVALTRYHTKQRTSDAQDERPIRKL